MRILHVVGARPNFMKAAPVISAIGARDGAVQILVHTGQHYDPSMSDVFFRQLELPQPDINLGVGSGSHAVQTAQIMMRMEDVLLRERPDWVLVYGDVNSTLAAALVCAKLRIPVAHVEAGLRSFDRSMPEEINRLITDQVSDLLFTPSADGNENLLREGVARNKIHLVGNVMIDTLMRLKRASDLVGIRGEAASRLGLPVDLLGGRYGLVTLHRPSNVDDPAMFSSIMQTLDSISKEIPLIFPVHPRTRQRLREVGRTQGGAGLWITEPVGYLEFLSLQEGAAFVVTDSGGIQEETTCLGVPCLTVRENTERPITVKMGTNVLVGRDMERLSAEVRRILEGYGKRGRIPPLWDGRASERIADVLQHTS